MLKEILSSKNICGVITALITPFQGSRAANKVNLDKYRELIKLAAEAKLAGVVALGTTGESPTLNGDERHAIIQTAINAAPEGLAVIVGTGTNNTRTSIENTRMAAELGADGALVVTPYYNKPTPAGLKAHFTAIADASRIPIILYHIPGRCGVGIPVDLALKLGEHRNIIAIKEAGGNVWRSGEIARQAPENFAVLSGDDNLTLPLMSVGVVGVISVISNIKPKLFNHMVQAMLDGRLSEARELHYKLAPLLNALSLETNPAPIKEAMNLIGMDTGSVRSPLAGVCSATKKALQVVLEKVGDDQ